VNGAIKRAATMSLVILRASLVNTLEYWVRIAGEKVPPVNPPTWLCAVGAAVAAKAGGMVGEVVDGDMVGLVGARDGDTVGLVGAWDGDCEG